MVNRHISPDIKQCALRLWQHGWSQSDICWIFCVSRASLYRWRRILEEFGSVEKPSSGLQGRPRILGIAAMSVAKEIYQQHPDTYLDELQWHLQINHDINISLSALQDNLVKAGLTRKILHKIACERDEQLRQDFKDALRTEFTGTGEEFICIDESSKNERDLARRYGRAMAGERAELDAPFVRGERYSLVAAMNTKGYVATRVVPGSLDSYEFFDFIMEEVVPNMSPFPGPNSVLVMDNCRIHHTDTLQDVLNEIGIMLLYLPPYSPDLNPIEESFSAWKAHLRRHGDLIQNADDPIIALLEACSCITDESAIAWFRHAGYIHNM